MDSFPDIASLGTDDTSMCSGNYISLVSGVGETSSYIWIDGSAESSLIIDSSGYYWVTVFNTIGCNKTDTIHVNIIGTAANLWKKTVHLYCILRFLSSDKRFPKYRAV